MRSQTRVLIIPHFTPAGGTRSHFKSLVAFCANRGCSITVALHHELYDEEILALGRRHGITYVSIVKRSRFFLWNQFPLNVLYDFLMARSVMRIAAPDITIVTTGTPGDWLGLIRFSRRFLYILHTYPSGQIGGRLFGAAYSRLLRSMLSPTKRIITVSRYSKRLICEHMLNSTDSPYVDVIYNHADVIRTTGTQTLPPKGNAVVLTLGHVEFWKNPFLWIEVARMVISRYTGTGSCEFIWAGEGGLIDQCREAARDVPGIRFIGIQHDIDPLFSSATVYFQPSTIESHGISVVEAMEYGIPCVVSNVGGLPESVVDGTTGFILSETDVNGMAERILLLLNDADLRTRFGKAGNERYLDLFTKERWKSEMTRLFDELVYR